MKVYELIVNDKAGRIVNLFLHKEDALITYRSTYLHVDDKPRYVIEERLVLERSTHL